MTDQNQEPIAVRFRPADRLIVKQAAELRQETVSQYVRRVVIPAARATVEATIDRERDR